VPPRAQQQARSRAQACGSGFQIQDSQVGTAPERSQSLDPPDLRRANVNQSAQNREAYVQKKSREEERKLITAHILYAELVKIWVQHRGLRDQVGVGKHARYLARSFPYLKDRFQVVVANAVRSLIMPVINDVPSMEYLLHELRQMNFDTSLAACEQLLYQLSDKFRILVQRPEIASMLGVAVPRLDVESATELWLSQNIRYRQWDAVAKAINALLPLGQKFIGGILPCTDTMKSWLINQGGRLSEDDAIHVASLVDEANADLVDLTRDEDDAETCGEDGQSSSPQAATHGYILKNAMQRVIAPEVESVCTAYPNSLLWWMEHGVDIVLAADGTSIVRFTGRSFKLELGACKVIRPDAAGAQQGGFMGIPLLIHDGEECYGGLKATLGRMIREGHLSDIVTITVNGEQLNLQVRWHLCADMKLVTLASGLGGASSAYPCFLCFWARSDPTKPAEARTARKMDEQAQCAKDLLRPLRSAESDVAAARKALNAHDEECKKDGEHPVEAKAAANARKRVELQEAEKTKLDERDKKLKEVLQTIASMPPSDTFLEMWQDPAWLQQRDFTIGLVHFRDCSKDAPVCHPLILLLTQIHICS
jgi:hypothetical protein